MNKFNEDEIKTLKDCRHLLLDFPRRPAPRRLAKMAEKVGPVL